MYKLYIYGIIFIVYNIYFEQKNKFLCIGVAKKMKLQFFLKMKPYNFDKTMRCSFLVPVNALFS